MYFVLYYNIGGRIFSLILLEFLWVRSYTSERCAGER
jgi:hypothetical protein